MLRHGGRRKAHQLDELADAQLAVAQGEQHAQAVLVRQRPKHPERISSCPSPIFRHITKYNLRTSRAKAIIQSRALSTNSSVHDPGLLRRSWRTMTPGFEELDYRMTRWVISSCGAAGRRNSTTWRSTKSNSATNTSCRASSTMPKWRWPDQCLARTRGQDWDVVVGGLGLGYTAAAALKFRQVKRLIIVEALEPVIEWHRKGLVPNGNDPERRSAHGLSPCRFLCSGPGRGLIPASANHRFDAVLLDIDHTPDRTALFRSRRFLYRGRVAELGPFLEARRRVRPLVERSA